jgi:hypothetical protein
MTANGERPVWLLEVLHLLVSQSVVGRKDGLFEPFHLRHLSAYLLPPSQKVHTELTPTIGLVTLSQIQARLT